MNTPSPSRVIATMRELRRLGVKTSSMDAAAIKFIQENQLVEQVKWPSIFIRITEAGNEYIAENSEPA